MKNKKLLALLVSLNLILVLAVVFIAQETKSIDMFANSAQANETDAATSAPEDEPKAFATETPTEALAVTAKPSETDSAAAAPSGEAEPDGNGASTSAFLDRVSPLRDEVLKDEFLNTEKEAKFDPLGYIVFISACDGTARAKVYNGTGKELSTAWDNAVRNVQQDWDTENSALPRWIRADVAVNVMPKPYKTVRNEIDRATAGFDFYGLSLDPQFEYAIIDGEINGLGIYNYSKDRVNRTRLNVWLAERGHEELEELPDEFIVFECRSWFLDEDNTVYPLCHEGADTGRRELSYISRDYLQDIIDKSSSYLLDQVNPDGTFIYGRYPMYDLEMTTYNILRHSGTIWSLICRYRMFPDDSLKATIENTIDYMLTQLNYPEEGVGYLHEAKSAEYKLGGNGIAIVTMTEYMDVFNSDKYRDACIALGEGILQQQDPEKGSYWHILNDDFSRGDEFRTVYYDGECTFALVRLYGLTGDQKWLDAACKAIDHFIAEDYTQYRDHWVAYSLNEVTKYVDREEYYEFALENATNNYRRIAGRWRTYPTNLELLISTFETWQRMVDKGIDTDDFDVKQLLDVISARAHRQLSGYFYPEVAMYMANPQRILNSFMMRNDDFRVRIDDVQHNIGGFYLYWKNYDAMIAAGLDTSVTDAGLAVDPDAGVGVVVVMAEGD